MPAASAIASVSGTIRSQCWARPRKSAANFAFLRTGTTGFATRRSPAGAADLKPAGPPIRTPEDTIGFAFDAAMTRYAIRLRDGTVLVRRMSDDQEVARFRSEGNRDFYVFVFSPNGQYLASKDRPSGALAVWDVDRSALCLRDPGPVSAWAARFSPDSRRIALGHEDGSLRIYEVKSGQPSKIWHGPGLVEDLAFRPDGKQLAVDTWGSPGTCRILDVDTGQLLRVIALDGHGSVAWSPDGTGLAITSGEAKISLWDAMTGQQGDPGRSYKQWPCGRLPSLRNAAGQQWLGGPPAPLGRGSGPADLEHDQRPEPEHQSGWPDLRWRGK